MENITLDPEYENLIIEVNKLKDKVAEKIAERDMLAFHVIPDIEGRYFNVIGVLENDAFIENIRLIKINKKIELYKEKISLNLPINEKEIDAELNAEFDDIEEEYSELQEETFMDIDDEYTNQVTSELLKLLNIIYKNLIKKLSPLINFNNTRIDNQLYEILEKSYRELDLSMMTKLQTICEQIKSDSNLMIGDAKTLKMAKEKYIELIKDNEEIILHIKNSDSFEKKKILENKNQVKKLKKELNDEISKIDDKIAKAQKELKKLQKESEK